MKTRTNWRLALTPFLLGALAMPLGGGGCETLEQVAEACDLACPEAGVLEGNFAISGIASIDAFFSAVVDFSGAAGTITSNVRAELDAMAVSLGLPEGSDVAAIRGAIEAKISANVSGGIKVKFKEPKCHASLEVTANAAASCDASVDPGSVEVKCEGSCTIDASAQADCSASGTLTCKGTAPGLACSGSCTGDCSLDVAATCEGTCRGTCNGTCSVKDSTGACKGECTGGTCQGTCELKAGGSCSGKCEGSCEYTPPSGTCEASAEAKCEASASASVKCKGGCEGKATPPSVKAECQATVEAKADASVECTPPAVDVSFQFAAGVDANAQAEFKAWIANFKVSFGGMLAAFAKAEILIDSAANLGAAGVAAIEGSATLIANGDGSIKDIAGAACALAVTGDVETALSGAVTGLEGSVSAVLEIKGAVGL